MRKIKGEREGQSIGVSGVELINMSLPICIEEKEEKNLRCF